MWGNSGQFMDLSPGELFFFWGGGVVYNSEELLNLRIRNCYIFAYLSKHGKTIHSPFKGGETFCASHTSSLLKRKFLASKNPQNMLRPLRDDSL